MNEAAIRQQENLQTQIADALRAEGKSLDALVLEDLAGVDEVHIGGLETIRPIVASLGVGAGDVTLDLGSGLGGPARFVARETGSRVVGVDLSADTTLAGNQLSGWVGFDEKVQLEVADVCQVPHEAESFDAVLSVHVHMFLEAPEKMFREAFRLLKPGGRFVVLDPIRIGDGSLHYPLPWSADPAADNILRETELETLAAAAGFRSHTRSDLSALAIDWFGATFSRISEMGGPPPLGLHLVMGPDFPTFALNAFQNLQEEKIALLHLVFEKP
ncbi:MAG: class I SAM-dependent methyltransferase [Rhodobiaceae bacterium]|nr:class I SAM-dependent methyltransferase [Rhodobiaceae bacterium]